MNDQKKDFCKGCRHFARRSGRTRNRPECKLTDEILPHTKQRIGRNVYATATFQKPERCPIKEDSDVLDALTH